MNTCAIDGCDKEVVARGWCRYHYARWRRTGTTDPPARREPVVCSIAECGRIAKSIGLCDLHYKRHWRNGDPSVVQRVRHDGAWQCSVDGCQNNGVAKGLCMNHYALMRRNGKPETVREYVGRYVKDGYVYIHVGNRRYEPEHRLVMEQHLGRKLAPDEHVHHRDRDTLNNALDNLEILSRSEHARLHRANEWTPHKR